MVEMANLGTKLDLLAAINFLKDNFLSFTGEFSIELISLSILFYLKMLSIGFCC